MGRPGGVARLLPLVLAALASTSLGAGEPHAFTGQTSPCHALVNQDPGGLCPAVRHAGVLAPGSCDAEGACTFAVSILSEGKGIPAVRKALRAELVFQPATSFLLCQTETNDTALSCGSEVSLAVPLADKACVEVRVRSTLTEIADVPPTLPIRAERAYTACRDAAALTLAG